MIKPLNCYLSVNDLTLSLMKNVNVSVTIIYKIDNYDCLPLYG